MAALLAWAGDDLAALRDRDVNRTRMAEQVGLMASPPSGQSEQFAGDPGLIATIQYFRTLIDAGQLKDAESLMRGSLRIDANPGLDKAYTKTLLSIRLANFLFTFERRTEGEALLESVSQDATIPADYRLNADVNLAMLLARDGKSQGGLITILNASRQFDSEPKSDDSGHDPYKVPDSEVNFAWIKACALSGMNQRAKTQAIMAGIASTSEVNEGTDATVRQNARYYGLACMHDAPALARELAAQLIDPVPSADIFVRLQVARADDVDRPTLEAALRDPQVAKAMAGKARFLPAIFEPAMHQWLPLSPTLDGHRAAR